MADNSDHRPRLSGIADQIWGDGDAGFPDRFDEFLSTAYLSTAQERAGSAAVCCEVIANHPDDLCRSALIAKTASACRITSTVLENAISYLRSTSPLSSDDDRYSLVQWFSEPDAMVSNWQVVHVDVNWLILARFDNDGVMRRSYKPSAYQVSAKSDDSGYLKVDIDKHPLANRGEVAVHRLVCWVSLGSPDASECHWCGFGLPWRSRHSSTSINVDHLDDVRSNNDPSNLVPSCWWCNANRSWGKLIPDEYDKICRSLGNVDPNDRPRFGKIMGHLIRSLSDDDRASFAQWFSET